MKEKNGETVALAAERTRKALFKANKSLTEQIGMISDRVESELRSKGAGAKASSQSVAQLLTAQGIAIDKLTIILRSLRNLEAETGNDLEASFVIIQEDEDGVRRIVSGAPELPALSFHVNPHG